MDLGTYDKDFAALWRRIGEEQRLNWIETLRQAAARIKLPSLQYEIGAQGEHAMRLCVDAPASGEMPSITQEMLDAGRHWPHMEGLPEPGEIHAEAARLEPHVAARFLYENTAGLNERRA